MVAACMVPTVLGGLIGVAHGVSGLAKLGELVGLGQASIVVVGPPSSTSDILWDVLFCNPWFATMGTCLLLSALGYARESRMSVRATRMIGRSIVAACVVVSIVWLLAVTLHWNLNADLLALMLWAGVELVIWESAP